MATGLDANSSTGSLGGFAAFPLADPVIIGDVSGNGVVDSSDVTLLNSVLAGVARPHLPPIPTGITITPNGPDPTLSLGAAMRGAAGRRLPDSCKHQHASTYWQHRHDRSRPGAAL